MERRGRAARALYEKLFDEVPTAPARAGNRVVDRPLARGVEVGRLLNGAAGWRQAGGAVSPFPPRILRPSAGTNTALCPPSGRIR